MLHAHWQRGVALLLALLLTACASGRPWQNQPLPPPSTPNTETSASAPAPQPRSDPSLLLIITLSGGGARAAAFGYGVLQALQQTPIQWQGRDMALLDQLDVISGVSGGSIVAAYYAAFGAQTFPAFEQAFLRHNFQDNLISTLLDVGSLYELSSPWLGRTHLLARRLDELYQGRTFGDLARRPGQPRLLVSATDLSLGASFEFTQSQFALICSDLASVPLSFAVAASSAVPIALSPMTLKNHNADCPRPPPLLNPRHTSDYRVRLLRENQRSYRDAQARPYIHLVDGGLADNLGLRSLLERSLADGGLRDSVRRNAGVPIQKLVIIAVNAERDPAQHIDASDQVPSTAQVLDALLFGSGARATQETLGLLSDTAQAWRRELRQTSETEEREVFAPEAQIHVVNVNLRDAPELLGRNALLQIPTAFSIAPTDVSRLIDAGAHILRAAPEFQTLLQSLAQMSDAPGKANK